MRGLDQVALKRAADVLDELGRRHAGGRSHIQSWREGDPISQDEFVGIVYLVVHAYLEAEPPPRASVGNTA